MSHDEHQSTTSDQKIVRMANQIGTFFLSKPHAEGVAGISEHINKFWDPRMRRMFFALMDEGDSGFLPIVREAAATVRRPGEQPDPQANAGAPGGQGVAAGESKAEIAASQG